MYKSSIAVTTPSLNTHTHGYLLYPTWAPTSHTHCFQYVDALLAPLCSNTLLWSIPHLPALLISLGLQNSALSDVSHSTQVLCCARILKPWMGSPKPMGTPFPPPVLAPTCHPLSSPSFWIVSAPASESDILLCPPWGSCLCPVLSDGL